MTREELVHKIMTKTAWTKKTQAQTWKPSLTALRRLYRVGKNRNSGLRLLQNSGAPPPPRAKSKNGRIDV